MVVVEVGREAVVGPDTCNVALLITVVGSLPLTPSSGWVTCSRTDSRTLRCSSLTVSLILFDSTPVLQS